MATIAPESTKISKLQLPDSTKATIKDYFAAHYKGTTTSALSDAGTTNPIQLTPADGSSATNSYIAHHGDIVAKDTNIFIVIKEDGASSTNNLTWKKIASTSGGTVTRVDGNNGIVGGPITSSGTLGLSLKAVSSYIKAVSNPDTTTTKVYPLALDSTSNTRVLGVAVPWKNTTYTIATGTENGKIKVTPGGDDAENEYQISVYGLKSAAFKDTTDTYSSTGTDPVTGKAVAEAIAGIASAMVYKGAMTIAITGSGTTPTYTLTVTTSSIKTGYVYKVTSVTNSYTGTGTVEDFKAGDAFIAVSDLTPTGSGSTYTITYDSSKWTVIPAGDDIDVTEVATSGIGITTESGSAITTTGTIKLKLHGTAGALDDGNFVANVGVNSGDDGNLAVKFYVDGTHSSSNKIATQSTVTNAIGNLDFNVAGTANSASKTIDVLKQENGVISATYTDISIAVDKVTGITTDGSVNGFSASTTLATSVDLSSTSGTSVGVYAEMDSTDTEMLVLKPIYYHTTTTNKSLSNVVQTS